MPLPYVIDNRHHRLADVLSELLAAKPGCSLDVATAYFNVGGFALLESGLARVTSLRLLIGSEPKAGYDIGLPPDRDAVKGLLRKELEEAPFREEMYGQVERLIAFLQQAKVEVRRYDHGFLHAKCWIFYGEKPDAQRRLFDRFKPVIAIVGSSNFTRPGLTTNRELNLVHKVLLDPEEAHDANASEAVRWLATERPNENITQTNRQLLKSEVGARAIIDLERWYDEEWNESSDFKQDLVELLNASKYGKVEYTPHQVYMKALYEYFRDDLEGDEASDRKSAVELTVFQDDAVRRARRILETYHGVMIADSVGLGKTWIGKKLLEDLAYHKRQKALVVAPASLRDMWERELREASIAATVVSQEELGREEFDASPYFDCDVVLVDEAHNFRNPKTTRYAALETILGANSSKGREGLRKRVILLTATPISNSLFDLYYQLTLITGGDGGYFARVGIGDLRRYFVQARRALIESVRGSRVPQDVDGVGLTCLFNLLEEVVVRRTRQHIKTAYPEALVHGRPIRFPERELHTVQYNLEATYSGIYDDICDRIKQLKLAAYMLEDYKKEGVTRDESELGREEGLVAIFKNRFLKRLESSVYAFQISVRRGLRFFRTFEELLHKGKLFRSGDYYEMLRFIDDDEVGGEDDDHIRSLAEQIDARDDLRAMVEKLEPVDVKDYDLARLRHDMDGDIHSLERIWDMVRELGPAEDAKLERLKGLLAGELKGQKVLLFSYFKDTARYLGKELSDAENPRAKAFLNAAGDPHVRRLDSGASPKERLSTVRAFAPEANDARNIKGSEKEIDLLISTDVLAEGQNLQDCGYLINYDLHWNPTRMVQRAGRIDRIGSPFERLHLFNMFPDEGLERLLGLVESLTWKIAQIDAAGMHDASILGEVPHPRDFNTLRRIRDGDTTVVDEEERYAELASSDELLAVLKQYLAAGGGPALEALPDGIHSGLSAGRKRGVFFFFRVPRAGEPPLRVWQFVEVPNAKTDAVGRVEDNRFVIAQAIQASVETPRVVDPAMFRARFDLHDAALKAFQASVERIDSLAVVGTRLDKTQSAVVATLQSALKDATGTMRSRVRAVLAGLREPQRQSTISRLKRVTSAYQRGRDVEEFISALERLGLARDLENATGEKQQKKRVEFDLERAQLVCFQFVA